MTAYGKTSNVSSLHVLIIVYDCIFIYITFPLGLCSFVIISSLISLWPVLIFNCQFAGPTTSQLDEVIFSRNCGPIRPATTPTTQQLIPSY